MRARRSPSDAHPSRLGRADLGHTWMLDQDGRWIWGASTGFGQQGSQQAEPAAAAWHQKRISGLGRLDWCGAFDQDLDLPRTMTKQALQPLAMCPPCEHIGQAPTQQHGSPEDRAPSVHVLILLGSGSECSFGVLHAAAGRPTQLFQQGFAIEKALLCSTLGPEQLQPFALEMPLTQP
ncbi:uncharacterized protein PAN0_022d6071 [Moesziomyces antarcticus]|uniref:Uncharacterized protein n=1 Tax=Pseudozyma antarctica TaxID=84753 RepID=A0A081CME5_PSEA2|nr:uncharacterized protein PAN0_022d6071 [Moesziomyces antarcticus]GAK67841.1 hypothetical protein PAN0_022d6071 [Moesziomyces antarcticus]